MTEARSISALAASAGAALACATLAGCADAAANPSLNEACRVLAICEEPAPAPVGVVMLCDASLGASCTRERLRRELGVTLAYVASRPGSRVRLAMLGVDAASTNVVGDQVVPAPHRGSEKSRKKTADAFVGSALEYFEAVSAPVFEAPPVKKSPLAESITKLAMADAGGIPRTLVVITDAREYSPLADFECRAMPKNETFIAKLRAQHVLDPGVLAGTHIQFVDLEMRPIPGRGCAVDIARQVRMRELWTTALRAAGAAAVRITDGPVTLPENPNDIPGGSK